MTILIKKATIIDPSSAHHEQEMDILVEAGKITNIQKNITVDKVEIIKAEQLYVSPGWLDIGVHIGDPGYEHVEDIESVAAAAQAGGYTAIACYPNTYPTVQSKSEVFYLKNNSQHLPVDFYPIGAVSKSCKGEEITEMYDMKSAGAVAFSDGKQAVQNGGLMMRALQYSKGFGGTIINQAYDKTIGGGGQVHEGITSTRLGIKGIPSLAEELMVQRDIYLAEYTQSKLHIANISTQRSVELIRQAKAQGLTISCSVAALNLVYDAQIMETFDTNFKVLPPLRNQTDIDALWAGLQDGTIDCITSNHHPVEEEHKRLEFSYASFGAIGLETAFALVHTHLDGRLSLTELIDKFAIQPRKILDLPIPSIKVGERANISLFSPHQEWTFTRKDIHSKSKNSPLLGKVLQGKVLRTVN